MYQIHFADTRLPSIKLLLSTEKLETIRSSPRKKGNNWYVGAINNWDKRDITIDFSFLGPGKWKAEVFKDGINANNNGNDYKREFLNISDQSHLAVHLAEGGGWAAIVRAE